MEISVIRPFDISILFLVGYHIHLFGLLLNRETGMGIAILSTSRGIMTDREARLNRVEEKSYVIYGNHRAYSARILPLSQLSNLKY
jgi:hypothetical protein